MTPRLLSPSVAASILLLFVAGAGIASVLGTSEPVLRGIVAGLALGWVGSAGELRIMGRSLRDDLPRAMRVLTGGFALRLGVIVLSMTWLEKSGLADGAAFSAGLVGAFFCFLPVLAAATRAPVPNGEARG